MMTVIPQHLNALIICIHVSSGEASTTMFVPEMNGPDLIRPIRCR